MHEGQDGWCSAVGYASLALLDYTYVGSLARGTAVEDGFVFKAVLATSGYASYFSKAVI